MTALLRRAATDSVSRLACSLLNLEVKCFSALAMDILKEQVSDLTVKNRLNLYVLKEGENVFYMRIHSDAATVYETSAEEQTAWMIGVRLCVIF